MNFKINYTKKIQSIDVTLTEDQVRYLHRLMDEELDRTPICGTPGRIYSHFGTILEDMGKSS